MHTLESTSGVLIKAPLRPFSGLVTSIPEIATTLGTPDGGDGVRSIAGITIQTPREERICNTQYTADLFHLMEAQEPMPGELEAMIRIKIACGALSVREHAVLCFGLPRRHHKDVRDATLPLVKHDKNFAAQSLKHAQKYNILSLGRQRQPTFDTFAKLLSVDPETVPPLQQGPIAPTRVLRMYTDTYGGKPLEDPSPQEAREMLAMRYEQDLQGKVFYPNPLTALAELHSHTRQRWRGSWDADEQIFRSKVLSIRPADSWPRTPDVYVFNTVGATRQASRQAAARLALDALGATNLDQYKA